MTFAAAVAGYLVSLVSILKTIFVRSPRRPHPSFLRNIPREIYIGKKIT
jgi:hypothetical protein